MDKDAKETFQVHAFKFNEENTISVTCSVKYCPPQFTSQCKVITFLYLVEKGPFIISGGSKGGGGELLNCMSYI